MPVTNEVLESVLVSAGFLNSPPGPLLHPLAKQEGVYFRPLHNDLYLDVRGMGAAGIASSITLVLVPGAGFPGMPLGARGVGPECVFHSDAAVRSDLLRVVDAFVTLSMDPRRLKCPRCRTRWLVPKHGVRGWFLSCAGWDDRSCEGAVESREAHLDFPPEDPSPPGAPKPSRGKTTRPWSRGTAARRQ